MLTVIRDKEKENIQKAARIIYQALTDGHYLYTFGTGHGHMLAEELFYRAGGLVRVRPILLENLMLHVNATASTEAERQEGLAAQILAEYPAGEGDVLIIASNSGRNAVPVELSMAARERKVAVIALTSLSHSHSVASRHKSGLRLFETVDIVIDNHGVPGDACIPAGENFVSPTSTVAGAAILQAIVAQVSALSDRGSVETFVSSNVDGGDSKNAAYIRKYQGTVKSL